MYLIFFLVFVCITFICFANRSFLLILLVITKEEPFIIAFFENLFPRKSFLCSPCKTDNPSLDSDASPACSGVWATTFCNKKTLSLHQAAQAVYLCTRVFSMRTVSWLRSFWPRVWLSDAFTVYLRQTESDLRVPSCAFFTRTDDELKLDFIELTSISLVFVHLEQKCTFFPKCIFGQYGA